MLGALSAHDSKSCNPISVVKSPDAKLSKAISLSEIDGELIVLGSEISCDRPVCLVF